MSNSLKFKENRKQTQNCHIEELSSCNEMMEDPEREKIRVSATQEGKREKQKKFNNNKNGEILGFLNHSIILAIFIHQ